LHGTVVVVEPADGDVVVVVESVVDELPVVVLVEIVLVVERTSPGGPE
jgi:hypothetical protein